MNKVNEPLTFTQEEIESAERHLKAEITKLERAIERKKKEIEDLQPKGFMGALKSNKTKIKEAEEELAELEDQLIDLQAMTGADYLRDKVKDKKGFFSGLDKNMLKKIGKAAEVAGSIIPGTGATVLGKATGALFKGLAKK
ncbi:MAG: phage neck protein fibritin [Bacteroidaceae bacterium]|nr:phage neck protein fibritin [Bacteroidaceae bacterium]